MMKHMMLLLIVLLLLGCGGGKDAEKKDAIDDQPIYYNFPLPSFEDVFAKLDYLSTTDYDKAIPEITEDAV
ncbi:MAG: hypothetical protein K8S56_05915, partial [Candidatus Cloacimonetes bacterium]|nr:hypothetical protein [Candidatus Cloacimonadota bacterium]